MKLRRDFVSSAIPARNLNLSQKLIFVWQFSRLAELAVFDPPWYNVTASIDYVRKKAKSKVVVCMRGYSHQRVLCALRAGTAFGNKCDGPSSRASLQSCRQ